MPSAMPGKDIQAIQSWWNPDSLLQSPPLSTISHKSNLRYSHHLSPQRQDTHTIHHTIHSWWKPGNLLQNRPHSTSTQESSIGAASASAILHGPKSPSKSHRQSNHTGYGGPKGAENLRYPPPRTAQTAMEGARSPSARNHGRKRIAGAQDSPRARRRWENSVALKDEAYIRRSMHVPTQEDYPSLKTKVFKDLKNVMNSRVRDGTLKKTFRDLGRGVFRYTLSCTSQGIEAVDGEGTSKVLRSDPS